MATEFQLPCIWGNYFLRYDDARSTPGNVNETVKKEHEELKQEVTRKVVKIQTTPITSKSMMPLKDRLTFIDTIQRLGLYFHFEKEIANIMQRVHQFDDLSSSDDLYTVSTAFRLFRVQGLYVPANNTFQKFLDPHGQLNESSFVSTEVDGLLALYEASYYAIHGEEFLDQAQEFARNKLKSMLPELEKNNHLIQLEKTKHVLDRSISRNCDMLVAKFYISIYMRELTFGESLLKFAIHDFNIRQAGFQKDLASLTEWCEESNLKKDVPYARHRLVEFYLWALCIYAEPQYALARMTVAKLFFMMTLIDDTYDTYGTPGQLELFTEAFVRLDSNAYPSLPSSMKAIIGAMKDLYAEIDQHNPGRSFVVYYLKREFERLTRGYLVDSVWIHSNTIPTYEEYFDVIIMITGSSRIFPCIYLACMGEVVAEEAFSWALDEPQPKFMEASAVITRFLDDLSPNTDEVGKPQNAIPVFMNHYGLLKEEAREMIEQLLNDAYKEVNKGLLNGLNHGARNLSPILKAVYGQVKGNDIFNRDHDNYSFPQRLKEFISSTFVEPLVQ